MVPVRRIIIGAEHCAETLAGAVMDGRKKLHFLTPAFPVIFDGYPAAVGQHKGRDIDRIGMRMFRQFTRSGDIAAAIATHGFDTLEVAAKIFARRAFHGKFGPGGKFARQLAFHRAQVGHIGSYIEQLDTVDLAASTTEMAVGQGREADIGFAEIGETLASGGCGVK